MLVSVLLVLAVQAPASPELTHEERERVLALSPLPPPPRDPTNAHEEDPRAARLGQALFFETGFSRDGSVS